MILPNTNDKVNIWSGIPVLMEKIPSLFDGSLKRVNVAIVDGGVNAISSKYHYVKGFRVYDYSYSSETNANGHGSHVAASLKVA